uniref:Uncharacterized protein n=1 Tax=Globodera rostochiensis TaxID=31243 RepID=A0A914HAQ4_GLORO
MDRVVFTLDLRRKKCHWTEVLENTTALGHFCGHAVKGWLQNFFGLDEPIKGKKQNLGKATSSDAASIWQLAKSFTQKNGRRLEFIKYFLFN